MELCKKFVCVFQENGKCIVGGNCDPSSCDATCANCVFDDACNGGEEE